MKRRGSRSRRRRTRRRRRRRNSMTTTMVVTETDRCRNLRSVKVSLRTLKLLQHYHTGFLISYTIWKLYDTNIFRRGGERGGWGWDCHVMSCHVRKKPILPLERIYRTYLDTVHVLINWLKWREPSKIKGCLHIRWIASRSQIKFPTQRGTRNSKSLVRYWEECAEVNLLN